MYSDSQYDDQGYKIFRDSDIQAGKYFNKKSGKWVSAESADIARERAKEELPLNIGADYTREPYSINKIFRDQTTVLQGQGIGWTSFIAPKEPEPVIPKEPTKRGRKKKEKGISPLKMMAQPKIYFEGEEKEQDDDDEEEEQTNIQYLFGKFKKS